MIKNLQLMKSFEKWSGSLLFDKMASKLMYEIEEVHIVLCRISLKDR